MSLKLLSEIFRNHIMIAWQNNLQPIFTTPPACLRLAYLFTFCDLAHGGSWEIKSVCK